MSTPDLRARRAAADTGARAGTVAGPGSPVTSAPLVPGLYQSAYSARNDVLWATAAVGQPPAPLTSSRLLRIDPDTLEVEAAYSPPVTDTVEAVYGIDVDDEHNTVWVTDTRSNSVAVYSQRTGEHLATRHDVAHAREVVVDERHDTVWASAFGDGTLVATTAVRSRRPDASPWRVPGRRGSRWTSGRARCTPPITPTAGSCRSPGVPVTRG
ncbi:hypothetical protein ABZ371_17590 [Streptomyces sp. NPDC005899]|uniref:YncE family protein n=1 Tax=Streptomyces sp. NPDC005899 TaxID=3155716 RepID=UPI0033CF2ABA